MEFDLKLTKISTVNERPMMRAETHYKYDFMYNGHKDIHVLIPIGYLSDKNEEFKLLEAARRAVEVVMGDLLDDKSTTST